MMPMKPGTVLTPASAAIFLDSILSPMAAMALGGGPMKASPAASSASTKSAFSDRKPKPGWIAWAPVSLAAWMIRSARR